MSKYSCQNSISIKRLRNGDTIFLTLEMNGKPLFQTIDKQTGAVAPDWSVTANQPIITPNVGTTRNNSVLLSGHSWQYNSQLLAFNGESVGGFTPDSTGKFAMDPNTGALKIIGNLASPSNMANDTLTYSVVASVGGINYSLNKSVDIQIQLSGASSYFGFINLSTTQLDSDHPSAMLKAELWLAASALSSFHVKWYKGEDEWSEAAGMKEVTLSRDQINGTQLVIAEFYLSASGTSYVYKTAVSIIDTLDEILVVPYISSVNKEVDDGKPVTVAARIVKASTGGALTPANPVWKFTAMDGDTWEEVASSSTPSITISTEHTDRSDGTQHDIEVLVQVSFDSLS